MSDSISGILSDNVRSINAANRMEQILYKESSKIFDIVKADDPGNFQNFFTDSLSINLDSFENQLALAANNITHEKEKELVAQLGTAYERYKITLKDISDLDYIPAQEDRVTWYFEEYHISFSNLIGVINEILTINQNILSENASNIEQNYYRMIMPSVISVLAGFLLTFFFNYIVNVYFISPILSIKRGVTSFLKARIPYTAKVDTKDEISELNSEVGELIELLRRKEKESSSANQ